MKTLKTFRDSEDGAVTVDWVVLAAMIAALCVLAATLMNGEVSTALSNLAQDIHTVIARVGP
ncbi:hypothetical protein HGG73_03420 [Rhodobacteraceae bacterium R_SAG3]|nr:hypothetical protein [Rhodobacteraceae bacterium R_SAG3]